MRRIKWQLGIVCLLACLLGGAFAAERATDREHRGKPATVPIPTQAVPNKSSPESGHPLTARLVTEGRSPEEAGLAKARSLLSAADSQQGAQLETTLQRLLQLALPATPSADKIRYEAHRRLGDLYSDTPSKQVAYYAMAVQYAEQPSVREALENRIEQLGGDPFALQMTARPDDRSSTRNAGPDDHCDGATAMPIVSGVGNKATVSGINITPSGDHNFYSFTVPSSSQAWSMRITTTSDMIGTFTDDTDLTLWDGCNDPSASPNDGVAVGFHAFNDDGGTGNGVFMSEIVTPCDLLPGTYFVEVGGFFDIGTPDNFELQIEILAQCDLPVVDSFENDGACTSASKIGFPTSNPSTNAFGRYKKEVQAHSIFPAGDLDHVGNKLSQHSMVSLGTQALYPNPFTGALGSVPADDPDTVIELRYEKERDYYGRCNPSGQPCRVTPNPPLACPGTEPCVDIFNFNLPFGSDGLGNDSNPLAENDDRAAGSFGSQLDVCLPRFNANGTDGDDYCVRTHAWSASDFFNYEIEMRNQFSCPMESEPNDSPANADILTVGTTIYGIYDFAGRWPQQDYDTYAFTPVPNMVNRLESTGYDIFAVDTAFDLLIGPDDVGKFFLTGIHDDDGGFGFTSRIDVILPTPAQFFAAPAPTFVCPQCTNSPACQALCNLPDCSLGCLTASWILGVTSDHLNPNFPYGIESSSFPIPPNESQTPGGDFGDYDAGPAEVDVGANALAEIAPGCDVDGYRFTLAQSSFVTIETAGAGDTVLELRREGDVAALGCDDDGGPLTRSKLSGCLPPGDYYARVRAYGMTTGSYELEITAPGDCDPVEPPRVDGDGSFQCVIGFEVCP